MTGDGIKRLEQIGQPLFEDDAMGHVQLNARILQGLCWRKPASNLDFPRAQMIAGVGKQRRDFQPGRAEAKQLGSRVRSLERTSWSEF